MNSYTVNRICAIVHIYICIYTYIYRVNAVKLNKCLEIIVVVEYNSYCFIDGCIWFQLSPCIIIVLEVALRVKTIRVWVTVVSLVLSWPTLLKLKDSFNWID